MIYDEPEMEEEAEIVSEVKVDDKTLAGSIKVTAEISSDELAQSVVRQVRRDIEDHVNIAIHTEVKKVLVASSYYEKKDEVNTVLRGIIKEVVREEFLKAYPDAVTNQLNKMIEEVKKVSFFEGSSYDNTQTIKGLKEMVQKKIDALVLAEVQPLVKKQAEQIQEQVQANFAKNFIRTMIPLGIQPPT